MKQSQATLITLRKCLTPKQILLALRVQHQNLLLCEKNANEIFKDLSIKTSQAMANLKEIRYRVILQTSKALKNCFFWVSSRKSCCLLHHY